MSMANIRIPLTVTQSKQITGEKMYKVLKDTEKAKSEIQAMRNRVSKLVKEKYSYSFYY